MQALMLTMYLPTRMFTKNYRIAAKKHPINEIQSPENCKDFSLKFEIFL